MHQSELLSMNLYCISTSDSNHGPFVRTCKTVVIQNQMHNQILEEFTAPLFHPDEQQGAASSCTTNVTGTIKISLYLSYIMSYITLLGRRTVHFVYFFFFFSPQYDWLKLSNGFSYRVMIKELWGRGMRVSLSFAKTTSAYS